MFIPHKVLKQLNARIAELEKRVNALQQYAAASSYYFGKVTLQDYVRLTEKEIHDLKTNSERVEK